MLIAWRIISQDYQYPDDALLRPRAAMRGCHISDEAKIFFGGVPGGMRFARAFRIKPDRRAASRFAGGDPVEVMRRPRSDAVVQQCGSTVFGARYKEKFIFERRAAFG